MKKQICLISPKFSNHIGGMETHSYEFARAFSVDLEYPIVSILIKESVNDGIPAPSIEEQDSINGKNSIKKNLDALVNQSLTGNFEKDAHTILNGYDVENTIFYLNSPTWLPSLKLIKKANPDTRVIVRSGGNDIMAGWIGDETDTSRKLEESRELIVEMINTYVDILITNSNYSYNRSLSAGVNPERLVKVIGGVDCNSFYPNRNNNMKTTIDIITSARLVEFKGFEYSISAVKELVDNGINNIHYTLIGDGPEKNRIEKIVSNGLSEYVTMLGARRIEDMPYYFRQADIFLHMPVYLEKHERDSSYIHTETMGRCLCEASASGLPIVAAKVGGVPEIVQDANTGFLVVEKDYKDAAKRLTQLVVNHGLRKSIGLNGRKRAEMMYSWQLVFDKYKQIFRSC